jgi:GTP cyclohydrolase I
MQNENPITKLSSNENSKRLSNAFELILKEVGEDLNRPGLKGTPERAAKALSFLTKGYSESVEEIVNGAIFPSQNNGVVIVQNIDFYSMCEHHLLPFMGKCHIGYYPDGKVLGLSKLARIVDMFSRRFQIQEELTRQIAETINDLVKPNGVMVTMEGYHMCMMMRGVNKSESFTTTQHTIGRFQDIEEQKFFISSLKRDI